MRASGTSTSPDNQGDAIDRSHSRGGQPQQDGSTSAEFNLLRESLALRESALDASQSGIVIIDMRRRGRPIVYANKASIERTGYPAEELIGLPSKTLTPHDFNRDSAIQIRDAMQAGKELTVEYRTARKDGSLYWTRTRLVPIRDQSSIVTHYVSISSDITAHREAEQQSEHDRERLDAIMESALEGVVVINKSFRITLFNRVAERIFGHQSSEVLGQRLDILIPEHCRKANQQLLERFLESPASRYAIGLRDALFGLRAGGDEFPYEGSVSKVNVGNDTITTIMLRDISEELQGRKQQAKLETQLRLAQKLEAIGQLAAGIAHEINTPIQYVGDSVTFLQSSREDGLRILKAYRDGLQALEQGAPIQKVKEEILALENSVDIAFYETEVPRAFERTMDGIAHVTRIVRAMKEFSHPDATEHETADINHAIETTLVVARNEYKYFATVKTRLATLPPIVCNIGELNQVFLNLIVNAAHAINESGKDATSGRILVTTDIDGEYVKISVQDNGCGIPEKNLEKVFDPFFTTKPVGKGTGQGLAITQSIVMIKHGGTVEIESEVGVGTTLILRLPIAGRRKQEAIA